MNENVFIMEERSDSSSFNNWGSDSVGSSLSGEQWVEEIADKEALGRGVGLTNW